MSKNKIIIFGAGPSGLSTAYGVKKNSPQDIEMFEKKSSVGGLAGSFIMDKDFIDYGPHRLAIQNLKIKQIAESLLRSNILINKSQHGVQFKNRLYQFPPKIKDLINIKSIIIILKIISSYFLGKLHWFVNRYGNENFNEFIHHQFGKFFLDEIARPMSTKVWGDSNKIDPSFVTQRFSMIKPFEIFKQFIFPSPKLNPSIFYYPKYGGFQAIWDAMKESLENNKVKINLESYPTKIEIENSKIKYIEIQNKNGLVKLNTENSTVVSSIPIFNLIKIMNTNTDNLLNLAKEVRIRSMYLVIMKFNQNQTLPYRTLIFPEKEFIFNRIFEQNLYSRNTIEDNKSVIVADITFDKNSEFYSTDKIKEIVKEQIGKLNYINIDKLESIKVELIEHAYVSPEEQTRKNFQLIEKKLNEIENLELIGRFGVGEYDNSDYAILNGLNLSDYLTSKISKIEYDLIKSGSSQEKILG
tara:strand:+ start:6036 stop:7442 length:1407 start_codon:yes stop_codon:yes gene_type:complete